MGLSDSTLQACTKPCVQVSEHVNKYFLDECMCDSGCGQTCCHRHLETHAHNEDPEDSDFASVDSQNVAPKKEDA